MWLPGNNSARGGDKSAFPQVLVPTLVASLTNRSPDSGSDLLTSGHCRGHQWHGYLMSGWNTHLVTFEATMISCFKGLLIALLAGHCGVKAAVRLGFFRADWGACGHGEGFALLSHSLWEDLRSRLVKSTQKMRQRRRRGRI